MDLTYLNNFLLLTIIFSLLSWYIWSKNKWFLFYANVIIGCLLVALQILSKFRQRNMILLNNKTVIYILLLGALFLGFISLWYFLIKYKPFMIISYLEFRNNYYVETFSSLHRFLLVKNTFYNKTVYKMSDNFPMTTTIRVLWIVFSMVLPFIILNILLIKEICLGYLDLTLKYLPLLLTIPQIFVIWANIREYCFFLAYNKLLLLYNKIIDQPHLVPMDKLLYVMHKDDVALFQRVLHKKFLQEEFLPLFFGMTPDEYIEQCYIIMDNYYNMVDLASLLSLVRRYCLIITFFTFLLILFLNVGNQYIPYFVEIGNRFLEYLFSSFFF